MTKPIPVEQEMPAKRPRPERPKYTMVDSTYWYKFYGDQNRCFVLFFELDVQTHEFINETGEPRVVTLRVLIMTDDLTSFLSGVVRLFMPSNMILQRLETGQPVNNLIGPVGRVLPASLSHGVGILRGERGGQVA